MERYIAALSLSKNSGPAGATKIRCPDNGIVELHHQTHWEDDAGQFPKGQSIRAETLL